MASHQAIAAISLALKERLDRALRNADFPGARVELVNPADRARLAEGLSLILYRVGVNATLRPQPPRATPDGRASRPALPVDLHYLLSASSRNVHIGHALLGWTMRHMEDNPVLSGDLINEALANSDIPARAFRSDEAVEIVAEPLAAEQWFQLRSAFGPCVGASMTYVARNVLLETERLPETDREVHRAALLAKGAGR